MIEIILGSYVTASAIYNLTCLYYAWHLQPFSTYKWEALAWFSAILYVLITIIKIQY